MDESNSNTIPSGNLRESDSNSSNGIRSEEKNNDDNSTPASFFVERYYVYTHSWTLLPHGSKLFRGRVHHDPWPLKQVSTDPENFELFLNWEKYADWATGRLDNASSTTSLTMKDVLKDMSARRPDHACFSPGVGPVDFEVLQKV